MCRFVALFLDDESVSRVGERFPASKGARSATFALLEPTEATTDPTRPAIFAPLMGEKASGKLVGQRRVNGLVSLRAVVKLGEAPLEGDLPPTVSWGAANDDDVAHLAAKATEDYVVLEDVVDVSGIICRSDYFYEGECHLEPLLECPLCAYMKQSPCKDAFTAWEDCLNACEAEGGEDHERQTRFMETCAAQTLGLKECVDKYPEFFGSMFGAGPEDDLPASDGSQENNTPLEAPQEENNSDTTEASNGAGEKKNTSPEDEPTRP